MYADVQNRFFKDDEERTAGVLGKKEREAKGIPSNVERKEQGQGKEVMAKMEKEEPPLLEGLLSQK